MVNFAAQNGDVLDDLLLADRVEKPAGNVGDILVLKTKSNIPMVSMPSGRSAQRKTSEKEKVAAGRVATQPGTIWRPESRSTRTSWAGPRERQRPS